MFIVHSHFDDSSPHHSSFFLQNKFSTTTHHKHTFDAMATTSIASKNQAAHISNAYDKKLSGNHHDDEVEDILVKETTAKLSLMENVAAEPTNTKTATTAFSYTAQELEAMQAVYDKLLKDPKEKVDKRRIGLKTLALATIVSKLRVEEAVSKYQKFLAALETCGVTSLVATDSQDEIQKWLQDPEIQHQLEAAYAPCGADHQGRSIMWIRGHEILPGQEPAAVQAGILYWLAIHADSVSIQEGITFCIDTSNRKSLSKHGNEAKLQKVNQSYPLRPKALLIAGASAPMRIAINVLIKVASLFAKQKILQRIRFVTVEEAFESVPKSSAPTYLGGGGGSIDNVQQWVQNRLVSFPLPDIQTES